jgi:hypothetical protein
MKRTVIGAFVASAIALGWLFAACGPDTCRLDFTVEENTGDAARLQVHATCNHGDRVNDGLDVRFESDPECGDCGDDSGVCTLCPKTGTTNASGNLETIVTATDPEAGLTINVTAHSEDGGDSVALSLGATATPTETGTPSGTVTPTPTGTFAVPTNTPCGLPVCP